MRNKEDKKCKKGNETTIGKIIYGFLLFMPLFAIGVTCGYAMFNKNAYQSYAEIVDTKENILRDGDTIYQGQLYYVYFNGKNSNYSVTNQNMSIISTSTNIVEKMFPNETWLASNINFTYEGNRQRTIIYDTNNIQHNKFNYFLDNPNESIYFQTTQDYTFENYSTQYINYYSVNYTYGKVSDVFYYAVDKVTESPLFNWAQNSIIYTTTASTCTALSITTPFIPLLMSYWLIISVIYFLYDIALMLVWLIHRKIHELQESL